MELSSVKLIMADGGNKDVGVLKEKRARNRLDRPATGASPSPAPRRGSAVTRERKVSRIGRKMKQKIKSKSRGGRIVSRLQLALWIAFGVKRCFL